MSTHSICFCEEIRKKNILIVLLPGGMVVENCLLVYWDLSAISYSLFSMEVGNSSESAAFNCICLHSVNFNNSIQQNSSTELGTRNCKHFLQSVGCCIRAKRSWSWHHWLLAGGSFP